MVNSKKMSKSKVAMIALAILLALSLILTATGAWYTNKAIDSVADQPVSFQLDEYFSLTLGTRGENTVGVRRTNLGGSSEAVDPEQDGSYKLLPGDLIDITTDDAALTITAENAPRAFYYVYKVTGNSDMASANWYGADDLMGSAEEEARTGGAGRYALAGNSNTEIEITRKVDADAIVNNSNDDYIEYVDDTYYTYRVLKSLKTADITGGSFTITIGGVSVEVRTMQAQNIDAQEAYTFLTGDNFASHNSEVAQRS